MDERIILFDVSDDEDVTIVVFILVGDIINDDAAMGSNHNNRTASTPFGSIVSYFYISIYTSTGWKCSPVSK